MVAAFIVASVASRAGDAEPPIQPQTDDEQDDRGGDIRSQQRRYAWDVVARLDLIDEARHELSPVWHRSEDVFSPAVAQGGSPQPSVSNDKTAVHGKGMQSGEPQVITFSLYNDAAHRHIRDHRLYQRARLDDLLDTGQQDRSIRHNRTVPPFPDDAVIVLSTWWPIAKDRPTALPVWDPELNPARVRGNNYATWHRAVAVDRRNGTDPVDVILAGRQFKNARRVELDAFHHIDVDAALEQRTGSDDLARKAAVIALGRQLQVGDSLALVAIHVATKTQQGWVWTTLWWHDEAQRGVFADDRPSTLSALWRNYLLDVAVDAERPLAADGTPPAVFNPWLEARFGDTGNGGGRLSNCVACHGRASYPPVSFLPVTRGAPDLRNDPAYAPGRLRTDFIWSVARQAR